MAQTKRKRSSKHRGNAAGQIEARGRTGRKLDSSERPGAAGKKSRAVKVDRRDQPPTWKGSGLRALIAAVMVLAFVGAILGFSATRVATLLPLLVLYVPLGYYTDLFLYRRRLKQKGLGK